jgi:hypothetical protein
MVDFFYALWYTVNSGTRKEVKGTQVDRANFESWPAKRQLFTNDYDNELWKLTEANHPLVAWWWNQRTDISTGKRGAYCYICDKIICTFDGRWPMTRRAIIDVMKHREAHIQQLKLDHETAQGKKQL